MGVGRSISSEINPIKKTKTLFQPTPHLLGRRSFRIWRLKKATSLWIDTSTEKMQKNP